MKKYLKPILLLEYFDCENVILTSGGFMSLSHDTDLIDIENWDLGGVVK